MAGLFIEQAAVYARRISTPSSPPPRLGRRHRQWPGRHGRGGALRHRGGDGRERGAAGAHAARRVLRRPGGVIAVWGYNHRIDQPHRGHDGTLFFHTTLPYWDPRARYCTEGYRDLPFPLDDIGLGKEGDPASFDMEQEMSFEGLIGMLRSWSAVATARQRGVDLLGERVVKEMEEEWGGASLVRKVTFKFLLAGTPRADA